MTRDEFDENSDAMVIVVWFDHDAHLGFYTGYTGFTGNDDVFARAIKYKEQQQAMHPTRTYQCMINGAAVENWEAALTNDPQYD